MKYDDSRPLLLHEYEGHCICYCSLHAVPSMCRYTFVRIGASILDHRSVARPDLFYRCVYRLTPTRSKRFHSLGLNKRNLPFESASCDFVCKVMCLYPWYLLWIGWWRGVLGWLTMSLHERGFVNP